MATIMQKAFAHSKLKRKLTTLIALTMGFDITGNKRYYGRLFGNIFEAMSEPQIKYFLMELLQCTDATAEDKAEALRILRLSETALTKEQRQQIQRREW